MAAFENADWETFCAGADENVITWDESFEEHLLWEQLPECGGGFGAFGKFAIEHGEAYSEHVEFWIEAAYAVESFEEFWDGTNA